MISPKTFISLTCPECRGEMRLHPGALAIGRLIGCEHCSAELYLSYYGEAVNEPALWRLESYADEEQAGG
jgi:hypothetical protein